MTGVVIRLLGLILAYAGLVLAFGGPALHRAVTPLTGFVLGFESGFILSLYQVDRLLPAVAFGCVGGLLGAAALQVGRERNDVVTTFNFLVSIFYLYIVGFIFILVVIAPSTEDAFFLVWLPVGLLSIVVGGLVARSYWRAVAFNSLLHGASLATIGALLMTGSIDPGMTIAEGSEGFGSFVRGDVLSPPTYAFVFVLGSGAVVQTMFSEHLASRGDSDIDGEDAAK